MDTVQDRIQQCEITNDSEVTLSGHFIQILRDVYGHVISDNDSLWVYRDGIWERLPPKLVKSAIQCFEGLSFVRLSGSPARVSMTDSKVAGVYKSTMIRREILTDDDFFDDAPPGVCFKNGFVSLADVDGEPRIVMHKHSHKHKATMMIDQDAPLTKTKPAKFLAFLDELFQGDEDAEMKKACIQEFLGGALANISVRYQRCLLLTGSGANGKSTLSKIIELCFPPEHVSSTSPQRWSNEYHLALLANKRINICTELPTADSDVSDIWKAVISGDKVVARMPYQQPQHMVPKAAHVFSSNHLPSSKDFSEGFFRRFLIIQLNRNFQKEGATKNIDDIIESMKEERADIIMWALRGAINLIKRGKYQSPISGDEAEIDWRIEADAVLDFIVSCCNRQDDRGDFEYLSTVYEEYQSWCSKVGRKALGTRKFAGRLVSLDVTKAKIGGQTKIGLTMKPKAIWSDWDFH